MIRIRTALGICIIAMAMLTGCEDKSKKNESPNEIPIVKTELIAEDKQKLEEDRKAREEEEKLKEGVDLIFTESDKALAVFEQLSAGGNTDADFLEGYTLSYCNKEIQDYEKAFSVLEKASESNPYAKIALGYAYKIGKGVEADKALAKQQFEEAKNAVDEAGIDSLPYAGIAYELLGSLYYSGDDVDQDYGKAKELLLKSARLGDRNAMSVLGDMYDAGEGVDQNYIISKYWYYRAILQDSPDAMYKIACKYRDGKGFPRDYEKANKWYEKAADLGDTNSMNDLGFSYEHGMGVKQDTAKAVELYIKAADLGDAPAMVNLASKYIKGEGVEKDYIKAFELCEKSSERGVPNAFNYLGHMYQEGMGTDQDYAKAVDNYEKAIESGKEHDDIRAGHYTDLAVMYEKGLGVEKDPQKAKELRDEAERITAEKDAAKQQETNEDIDIEKTIAEAKDIGDDYLVGCIEMFTHSDDALAIFEKESETGNEDAEFLTGYLYYRRLPARERDIERANALFETISDTNPCAKLCLGHSLYYGTKMEKNEKIGEDLMDQAISEIDELMVDILPYSEVVHFLIGDYYYLGNNKDQYYEEAYSHFIKAENNPMALHYLGLMYYNGNGVSRDIDKTLEYLERAADLGDGSSAKFLGDIYEKGTFVTKDTQKAQEWYDRAKGEGSNTSEN